MSLLPANRTDFETVLEATISRSVALDAAIVRTLWNPHTCPVRLLDQLSWALAVDEWDDNWPEAVKRQVIASAIEAHRHRGTVHAVRRVLADLGVQAVLEEGWQTGGAPHTFRLTAWVNDNLGGDAVLSETLYRQLRRRIDAAKPVRSHYELRVGAAMGRTLAAVPTVGALQLSRRAAPMRAAPLTGRGALAAAGAFGGLSIARVEVRM
ncbi:phage tail protein I [Sulfurivirga sp.]|uniref:phage tail protein I n=1 Tax=Sulfurivirga sp. TaxID=2614236 RepID=UPI0025E72520|nr:phage tail protein I [Sulfurivirga sp.]